jgi:hypothetical protein
VKKDFNQRKNYVHGDAQRPIILQASFSRSCGCILVNFDSLPYCVVLARVEPDAVTVYAAIDLDAFDSLRGETLLATRAPVTLPRSALRVASGAARVRYLLRV